MAKKSMIQRELKRIKLNAKYNLKREGLLLSFNKSLTFDIKQDIQQKIQKLPRNSALTRIRNRCWKTGRSRGYLRDFGLSRHVFREMAHQGLIPGIVKASW